MNRRGFLLGLGAALAAPAIIPYANLMPVKLVDWMPRFMRGDAVFWSVFSEGVEVARPGWPLKWPGWYTRATDLLSDEEARLINSGVHPRNLLKSMHWWNFEKEKGMSSVWRDTRMEATHG